MTIQLGLIGHNGHIGSALLPFLLDANEKGKIHLVILHRPSSDLGVIPTKIERRIIRLDDHTDEGDQVNKNAVEGLEVLISTMSDASLHVQLPLLDILAASKTLKTFIQSDFGVSWTASEINDSKGLQTLVPIKEEINKKMKDLGIPWLNVRIGLLVDYFFGLKFLGTDVQKNKIVLYKDALNKPLRLTSSKYLGHALTQLILTSSSNLDSLNGRAIHIFNYTPSGQELIDTFQKVHHRQPIIEQYTLEEYERDSEDTNLVMSIKAGLLRKWGEDTWSTFDDEEILPHDPTWTGQRDLQDVLRDFM
ncbi:hypothetical protein I302_105187 [Kwoniella bestiolae CBS 10118]|uniref:NmrA-like domain-containing protein n=1 Tax=Kwoniella bestiolae CBS 10118 TaxID=1296100 RepID=A0A1B9FSE4_9TREE|nr:hypothetical protein I302_08474 [Kwoniella bestiolae CBS 10118]OCF21697.1 hypothetical protein I302_08474 [Kwoniella bestiolae CBS 10118]